MQYTRLKRDYEMKNGEIGENVEVMYNSVDNSIAYDFETDTYIINKKIVTVSESYDIIYKILSYELDLLGLEHFNKLISQYGEWGEFWLNEINEQEEDIK